MLDSIHKMFLAGVGLAVATKEKIDAHIEELVEKGKLSEKEGRDLAEDLLKKSRQARKDLQKEVEKRVGEILHKLQIPSKKDIEKLTARVKKLEAAKSK